jgi:hypothetical protein
MVEILIPAYIFPVSPEGQAQWNALLDFGAKLAEVGSTLTLVIDPSDGPKQSALVQYSDIIKKAAEKKVRLMGYVAVSYGTKKMSLVDAEFELYKNVGITDFFIDQAPARNMNYVTALHSAISTTTRTIAFNFGTMSKQVSALASKPELSNCIFIVAEGAWGMSPIPALSDRKVKEGVLYYSGPQGVDQMIAAVKEVRNVVDTFYITSINQANKPWQATDHVFMTAIEQMIDDGTITATEAEKTPLLPKPDPAPKDKPAPQPSSEGVSADMSSVLAAVKAVDEKLAQLEKTLVRACNVILGSLDNRTSNGGT